MARRITLSQFNSMVRQAQQKQKQAINKYNQEVRRNNQKRQQEINKYNQEVRQYHQKRKQAINAYNNEVRKHNARVHANRQRIASELNRLNSQQSAIRYETLRKSSISLNRAYSNLESRENYLDHLEHSAEFLDLSEQESANSLSVSNILEKNDAPLEESDPDSLKNTNIENHLSRISPELDKRWRGALFSLSPLNPDASRHFCTSAREIFSEILDIYAPNDNVLSSITNCNTTDHGVPTRKAKIEFILSKSGILDSEAVEFVEEDISNILTLFRVFNDGTHGSSGHFDIDQLISIKSRVEDGIIYLSKICGYT